MTDSQPLRHWVCSLPFQLRHLLGSDRVLCADVLSAFVQELSRSYRRRVKSVHGLSSISLAQAGAMTVVQRTDSALRLAVHFHTIAIDGVYSPSGLARHESRDHVDDSGAPRFLALQHEALKRRAQGRYNYFGVSGNSRSLLNLADAARKVWYKWLRRRSQRSRLDWQRYAELFKRRWPLPRPGSPRASGVRSHESRPRKSEHSRHEHRFSAGANLWLKLPDPPLSGAASRKIQVTR